MWFRMQALYGFRQESWDLGYQNHPSKGEQAFCSCGGKDGKGTLAEQSLPHSNSADLQITAALFVKIVYADS